MRLDRAKVGLPFLPAMTQPVAKAWAASVPVEAKALPAGKSGSQLCVLKDAAFSTHVARLREMRASMIYT